MNNCLETKTKVLIGPNCREFGVSKGVLILISSYASGSGTVARPVIPKRGEKDFEPNAAGGSGLQRHVLDRARSAMVDALSVSPSISRYVAVLRCMLLQYKS